MSNCGQRRDSRGRAAGRIFSLAALLRLRRQQRARSDMLRAFAFSLEFCPFLPKEGNERWLRMVVERKDVPKSFSCIWR